TARSHAATSCCVASSGPTSNTANARYRLWTAHPCDAPSWSLTSASRVSVFRLALHSRSDRPDGKTRRLSPDPAALDAGLSAAPHHRRLLPVAGQPGVVPILSD